MLNSINVQQNKVAALGLQNMNKLRVLSEAILVFVKQDFEALRNSVSARVKLLSLEELRTNEPIKPIVLKKPSKSRKQIT